VHLYPAGGSGAEIGVAQGQIVGHGQGHGTAELTMPDGEIMQGGAISTSTPRKQLSRMTGSAAIVAVGIRDSHPWA
jgi:hypothetical protein